MANPELKILIAADSKDLQKEIARAEKQLNSFKQEAVKAGGGTKLFNKNLRGSLPAAQEFSRVIQDLPFGIQGVGNNLQQLSANFGNLTRTAGGVKQAVTSVAASLLSGPGALIFAVSAVTTALTLYQQSAAKATKETNALTDATKDLIGSAKSELSVYNSLLSVAQDNNRSLDERQKALDKVNEKSGKYVGNLTLEEVNSGKATIASNKYSESLLRQARIKGLQNRLSELFAKQYELETKAIEENVSTLDKVVGVLARVGSANGALAQQQFIASQGAKKQADEVSGVTTEITKLESKIKSLIGEDISLDGIFTSGKDGGKKAVEQVRNITNGLVDELEVAAVRVVASSAKIGEGLNIVPINVVTQTEERLLRMQIALDRFNQQASNIINNGIANTFQNLAVGISRALATGGNVINAAGSALLGGLGQILIDLGKMAIRIGLSIAKIKIALKSLNPAVAIAAGAAAIALGTAFKKGASNLADGIGGGGSRSSRGVGGFGSRSSGGGFSTASAPSSGGFSGGTVVFEIAGTKLVGVLNNQLNRNRALGGQTGALISG